MKQITVHPGDVVVALEMALHPESSLSQLADGSRRSIGEAHNAISRLRKAGLVDPESRRIEREPMLQFIRWGVPFAYPPVIGGATVGVPTAMLSGEGGRLSIGPTEVEFVWASSAGTAHGSALAPLHPGVPALVQYNVRLYELLTAVDLIRVGGARERVAASAHIERALEAGTKRG